MKSIFLFHRVVDLSFSFQAVSFIWYNVCVTVDFNLFHCCNIFHLLQIWLTCLQMTQRLELYAESLTEAVKLDYQPPIIKE